MKIEKELRVLNEKNKKAIQKVNKFILIYFYFF